MKIKLIICTNSFVGANTADENQLYADEVKYAIMYLYPSAEVDVTLSDNPADALYHITGFRDNYGVSKYVKRIAISIMRNNFYEY